jgi:ABC-2 type transport system ATP-binding protein
MADDYLVVAGLHKRFNEAHAVRGISLRVAKGSTVALLGGNGAGKTTTLSMLLGLLAPSEGSITIFGKDFLDKRNRYDCLAKMNFTSPYVDLPKRLTVRENLRVFADLYNLNESKAAVERIAEELDLTDFINRPYGNLSAGQKTRVSLAKALLNEPALLLLDEPTASLDPDMGDRMRSLLERYRERSGCSMLIASHNMAEVERLCDDVIMMKQGEIVDHASPADLISRYGRVNLEEVFLDIARRPE